jgi:virginiamycin B lyase
MKSRLLSALVTLTVIASPLTAGTITGLTQTRITNIPKFVWGTTAGPDGNVWFFAGDDFTNTKVGRRTAAGTITLFPLPNANSGPSSMTTGLDGNLWFTEQAGRIGRISLSGALVEIPVGNPLDASSKIVAGADGGVWFLDQQFGRGGPAPHAKLGRIDPSGALSTYDLGTNDTYVNLITGPDGNLWLYDSTNNSIENFSLSSKTITATYHIPTAGAASDVNGMVIGPDGNVWFTHANSIDRIKIDGTITEYVVPTAGANPSALVPGGDHNLWFTEYAGRKVGQLIVSSATDSGKATINESDAILEEGAVEIVPIGGAAGAPNTATARASIVTQDDNPCLNQTFVVRFTVLGNWYEIKLTGDIASRCADILVISYITANAGSGRTKGRKPALADCYVTNLGPSSATNLVANCSPMGTKFDMNGAKQEGKCNFVPTAGGDMMITTGTLAKGEHCEFWTGLVENFAGVPAYALNIQGASDTFDPYMPNNGNVSVWDPDDNKLTYKWFFDPEQPLTGPPPTPRGRH